MLLICTYSMSYSESGRDVLETPGLITLEHKTLFAFGGAKLRNEQIRQLIRRARTFEATFYSTSSLYKGTIMQIPHNSSVILKKPSVLIHWQSVM